MELDERVPIDPFKCRDSASGWTAVWMGRTIQQLRQCFASANRRVVLILSKERNTFGPSFRKLALWKDRRTRNIHHQIEDGVEILRKTRAGERHRVASRSDAERDAPSVELLGNRVSVPDCCAAIDDAGGESGKARQLLRVIEA